MVVLWKAFQTKYDSETSWRLSFIVPGAIVLVVAIGQFFLSDDCPKGNYSQLERHRAMSRKSSAASFKKVRRSLRILVHQPNTECRVGDAADSFCFLTLSPPFPSIALRPRNTSIERTVTGLPQLQLVDHVLPVRRLLRSGADREQHSSWLLLRLLRSVDLQGWPRGVSVRSDEHIRSHHGRHLVRYAGRFFLLIFWRTLDSSWKRMHKE